MFGVLFRFYLEDVAGSIDVDIKHCSCGVREGGRGKAAAARPTKVNRGSITWELLVSAAAHGEP